MRLKVTRHFYYQEIPVDSAHCLGSLSFELKALLSPGMSKPNNLSTKEELLKQLVQTLKSGSMEGGGRGETEMGLEI